MNTVDKIRCELQRCSDYNGGIGLMLPPSMAKNLVEMGIDGPFHVIGKIPKIKRPEARG